MADRTSKGSGGKPAGRARAREHIKRANDKTKRVLEAVRKNVNDNVDVLNDLSEGFLADDSDHTLSDCATDLVAATVACWGNAFDLYHEVVKTCLPDKKDPSTP